MKKGLFQLFQDKTTKDYIDGIAIHWYWDKFLPASLLTTTHNKFPEKFLIGTEASIGKCLKTYKRNVVTIIFLGDKPWEKKTDLGSWSRGEDYAADIIRVLKTTYVIFDSFMNSNPNFLTEPKSFLYWLDRLEHGARFKWRTYLHWK